MTLYEIDSEIVSINQKIEQYAMENDGLIPPDLDQMLEGLQMDREKKIGNIARYLKNVKADETAIENEIAALTAKKKAISNKVESVKKFLSYAVGVGNVFKDPTVSIYWKETVSTVVDDPKVLPLEYQRITVEAKSKEIKDAIQVGNNISGAFLVSKQSMVMR